MILLALSAHRVFLLAMKDSRSWSDYLYLTALVITFSLGKVSIGFGFAVLVGFFLLI